jgi:hypothetical protein
MRTQGVKFYKFAEQLGFRVSQWMPSDAVTYVVSPVVECIVVSAPVMGQVCNCLHVMCNQQLGPGRFRARLACSHDRGRCLVFEGIIIVTYNKVQWGLVSLQ